MGGRRSLSGPRRGRAPIAIAAVAMACLACLAAGCSRSRLGLGPLAAVQSDAARRSPPPLPAQVTVSPRAAMIRVPRSYLGLSTEYWTLPQWSPFMSLLERALALVHAEGDGPLVLRVGGDSADHTFWHPAATPLPPWAFSLRTSWLRQARRLVRALGIRLLLDLNLITDSPAGASEWARAAERGLPRGSVVGFEVGNEPDIYSRRDWRAITAPGARPDPVGPNRATTPGRFADPRLPAAMTPRGYVRAFRAYARALARVAPRVPVAGPALANPVAHRGWVRELLAGARDAVGLISIHRYPYTGCPRLRRLARYATIRRLLSPAASIGMAAALAPVIDAAHAAGRRLRLTELNSVNCGGRSGVSDAFATALWAPDALFALLRAGVDGVNLHVRDGAVNAPFALSREGLDARPLLYGLILFARTLGPRARLVSLHSSRRGDVNLGAWAVRVGRDMLHVLLIDRARRSLRVSLRLPATGAAGVQRLLAPSASARTGVTLGGRTLAPDGSWRGTAVSHGVAPARDGYVVDVRERSAALVSVRIAPGALGVPRASLIAVPTSGGPR